MSKQREALQMALKALEEIAAHYPNDWEFDICIQATKLACEALAEPDPTPDPGIRWYAQRPCFSESPAETDWSTPPDRPEPKPVGTVFGWYGGYPMIELFPSEWMPAVGTVLYSAPPARKPLTDKELWEMWVESPSDVLRFARAIERAHGIGDD